MRKEKNHRPSVPDRGDGKKGRHREVSEPTIIIPPAAPKVNPLCTVLWMLTDTIGGITRAVSSVNDYLTI